MAQTRITNTDIKKPLTQENITLGSGVNILNIVSGINNIGSAALPMGTIYADHIIGTGIGGDFVHVTGGSMSGSLNMGSGANVLSNPSGSSNVGSPSLPFNNIYANNLTIGGQSLADVFVNVSGDTMTGPLAISSGNLSLSNGSLSLTNGTITSSGNITTTAGGVIITYPGLLLARGIQPAPGGGGISLYDTDGSGGVIDVLAASNMSGAGGKIFLESQQGSGIAGVIKLTAGAGVVTFSGQTFTLSNALNLLTAVSGGSNIGSPTVPFGNIYAQNLVGPTGGFLNIAGGQMDGTLNFATGIGITFDGSGTSNIGEPGFPVGTLYVNNIVSTGSTGEFVNVTGDTMTGDLNFSGSRKVSGTSTLTVEGQTVNIKANASIGGYVNILGPSSFGTVNIGIDGQSAVISLDSTSSNTKLHASSITLGELDPNATMTPTTSGTVNIGTAAFPFSGVYAKTGYFTNISGMSPINIQSDLIGTQTNWNIKAKDDTGSLLLSANDTGGSSYAELDLHPNGSIDFNGGSAGNTRITISSGSSMEIATDTGAPISIIADTTLLLQGNTSVALNNGSNLLLANTSGVTTYKNIIPNASGTLTLGTAALPFSGVYAKFINTKVIVTSVYNEVPSGLINGSNLAYTLLFSPYGNSLQLFKNGLYMSVSGLGIATTDCSLSGSTITFITAPASGSSLVANYNYLT